MFRQIALLRALALIAAAAAHWPTASLAQERFVLSHEFVAQAYGGLAVNPRTNRLALWMRTGGSEGGRAERHISIYDLQSRQIVTTLPRPDGVNLSSLAFSPDGAVLASGESGRVLRVWSTDAWTEKILWEHKGNGDGDVGSTFYARELAFSASGNAIAIAHSTKRRKLEAIYVLDARSGGVRSTIKPSGILNDMAFLQGGRCLAVSMWDPKKRAANARGKVEFWDIRAGRRISKLSEGAGPLRLQASPQQDVMATISGASDRRTPGTIKLWDLNAGFAKNGFSRFQELSQDCLCAAFSPSGAMIAVGHLHPARRVTVYAVATGAIQCTLDHDEGQSIANVAFAAEDEVITTINKLAGEKAPTVLLWKLPQSKAPSTGFVRQSFTENPPN